MAASDKDTIYVDIDDEITGIIDKVRGSSNKVVALVLPKRASVFQSIVNMKLLKRAADSSKKNLVLITSEAGLLPLAGAAGIHVAKSLTSRPEIPQAPVTAEEPEEEISEAEETPGATPDKTVGELSGAAAADKGVETVVLDDELPPEAEASTPGAKTFEPPKKQKKDKKLKIPDFNRFRLLLALGILLLILLIGGFIFAATALPKAVIAIKTNATNLDTNLDLNLSTAAKQPSTEDNTLPAKLDQQQKSLSQQVPTTGQKNNGNKASGAVNMSAQECAPNIGQPPSVPAGTGVSSNGLTYITQEETTFNDTGKGKGSCITYQAANSTTIIAQNPGSNYNGATSFTVAGRQDVTASPASQISGGTDNIVQTVNQNDINTAKSKLSSNDNDAKQNLSSQLKKENKYPIIATFSPGTPTVSTSAAVGDVATTVTVTEVINYSMFGVNKSDLEALIKNSLNDQIDTSKQSILDTGLDKATFNVNNQSGSGAQLTLATTAVAGPQLDVNAIRNSAAGKKPGAIRSDLENSPGVTNVDVKLSPFWVSSVPKKLSRIHVDIAKPTNTTKNSTNGKNP